jgi:hypothetical protein
MDFTEDDYLSFEVKGIDFGEVNLSENLFLWLKTWTFLGPCFCNAYSNGDDFFRT